MLRNRSGRRRTPVRNGDPDEGEGPSILEIALEYLTERLARSAILRVRYGIRETVSWSVRRAMAGLVIAAALTTGIVLLLLAAVRGLQAAGCPPWAAFLSAGAAAVAGALLCLHLLLPPLEDPDDL